MSYSSTSLIAAMNKSICFKDVFKKDNNTGSIFRIGEFEKKGYFKVTLLSIKTTVIIEFSQGKIISVQSISQSHDNNSKYAVLLNDSIDGKNSILYVDNLFSDNDLSYSVTIEFSGGEFLFDPLIHTEYAENAEPKEFSFNSVEYVLNLVTSGINIQELSIGEIITDNILVKELQLGLWNLTSDTNGNINISLRGV